MTIAPLACSNCKKGPSEILFLLDELNHVV